MTSSDFGKLDAMRQLTVGCDCASAGAAITPADAPAAAFLRKERLSMIVISPEAYGVVWDT
jgi:hypothetical protein